MKSDTYTKKLLTKSAITGLYEKHYFLCWFVLKLIFVHINNELLNNLYQFDLIRSKHFAF